MLFSRKKLLIGVVAVAFAVPAFAQRDPLFKTEILPVLEKNCVSCHSPERKMAKLDLIAADVKARHLTNVDVVFGEAGNPRLPQGAVDLVLIANAYHEFSQPDAMMAAVRRSLKPNGRVVVIEYVTENTDDPIAGLYTMSLQEIRFEIESMGFRLDRVLDFLPLQHGLVFTLDHKSGLK